MTYRLSHSSIEMFKTCPKKWYMHYQEKLRSKTITSALYYGGYVGESVQLMVLSKKPDLTDEEKDLVGLDPLEFFQNLMKKVTINKTEYDLPRCKQVWYYKGDYDGNILTDDDHSQIKELATELGMFVGGVQIEFSQLIDAYQSKQVDNDEKEYMNFHFYLSLLRKGEYIINAYREEVLPRIVKVHSIEKEINLVCGEDSLIGYIDMVADWRLDSVQAEKLGKNEDDVVTILFDNKTSSAKYKKSKIETDAPQLALYDYAEQIGIVGYIVMIKKLKTPKRGPKTGTTYCDIQVLVGQVPEEESEKVLDKSAEVLDNIYEGKFEATPCQDSCFAFRSRCPYYSVCQEDSDDTSYLYCGRK